MGSVIVCLFCILFCNFWRWHVSGEGLVGVDCCVCKRIVCDYGIRVTVGFIQCGQGVELEQELDLVLIIRILPEPALEHVHVALVEP